MLSTLLVVWLFYCLSTREAVPAELCVWLQYAPPLAVRPPKTGHDQKNGKVAHVMSNKELRLNRYLLRISYTKYGDT